MVTDSGRAKWTPPLRDEEVEIAAGPVSVAGHLTIPVDPKGSSCSRTAAAAAGTARATASSPTR